MALLNEDGFAKLLKSGFTDSFFKPQEKRQFCHGAATRIPCDSA